LITGTFLHLNGVGPVTEERLRTSGVTSWVHLLEQPYTLCLSPRRQARVLEHLQESLRALEEDDIAFFVKQFPVSEHWRILARYLERTTFFDIETSGLSRYTAEVTVVSVLHRGRMQTFVRDENLDGFLDLLEDVDLLASFNGNCFDIPFVLDAFRIPELPCPHIDLRWVCYHEGLRGGLKDIEKTCLRVREQDLASLDGLEAVLLWNDWRRRGNRASLELLIRYCESDVAALDFVARYVLDGRGALP